MKLVYWSMFLVWFASWGPLGCPEVGAAKRKPHAVTCKTVKQKECPYCEYTLCTDGVTQWDEGAYSCAAVICDLRHNEVPVQPSTWH